MVVHAVNYQVVNGDVVLYQMLFAVQMVNIVARVDTPVQEVHASKDFIQLSYSRRNLRSRWAISVWLLVVGVVYK